MMTNGLLPGAVRNCQARRDHTRKSYDKGCCPKTSEILIAHEPV
jgi:hypothetical protein